eukprot:scaffold1800_cov237-Pinguiococcus_pyrenoidosus.AAC.11
MFRIGPAAARETPSAAPSTTRRASSCPRHLSSSASSSVGTLTLAREALHSRSTVLADERRPQPALASCRASPSPVVGGVPPVPSLGFARSGSRSRRRRSSPIAECSSPAGPLPGGTRFVILACSASHRTRRSSTSSSLFKTSAVLSRLRLADVLVTSTASFFTLSTMLSKWARELAWSSDPVFATSCLKLAMTAAPAAACRTTAQSPPRSACAAPRAPCGRLLGRAAAWPCLRRSPRPEAPRHVCASHPLRPLVAGEERPVTYACYDPCRASHTLRLRTSRKARGVCVPEVAAGLPETLRRCSPEALRHLCEIRSRFGSAK